MIGRMKDLLGLKANGEQPSTLADWLITSHDTIASAPPAARSDDARIDAAVAASVDTIALSAQADQAAQAAPVPEYRTAPEHSSASEHGTSGEHRNAPSAPDATAPWLADAFDLLLAEEQGGSPAMLDGIAYRLSEGSSRSHRGTRHRAADARPDGRYHLAHRGRRVGASRPRGDRADPQLRLPPRPRSASRDRLVVHLRRHARAHASRCGHHAHVRSARRGDPRVHPRGEARGHRVPAHASRGGGGVRRRRVGANRSAPRRVRLDARARRAQHDARRRQRVSRSLAGGGNHGDDGGGVGAVCDASESRSECGVSPVHQGGDHPRRQEYGRQGSPRPGRGHGSQAGPGAHRGAERCRKDARVGNRRPAGHFNRPAADCAGHARGNRCGRCGHRFGTTPGRGARPRSAPARSCGAGAGVRRASRCAGVRDAEGQGDAVRRIIRCSLASAPASPATA